MSLDLKFVPEKLIQTRTDICKDPDPAEKDSKLEGLVRRLSGISGHMAKAAAVSLSDKEVQALVSYLPFNDFGIDEKPVFEILKNRMDRKACQNLFASWQDSFDNSDCNYFIKKLVVSDSNFKELLGEYNIDSRVFFRILNSRNIPLSYDEELIGKHFTSGEDFDNRLRRFGVVQNSLLEMECKRALLTFCGKADYLDCSDDNILYIVRDYDPYMFSKFLMNFLDKMDIWELQIYSGLAEYTRGIIGHKRSASFASFFEGADKELTDKYLNWINIHKINRYFDNDQRSRFWKQFRFDNVIRYSESNTVVLDMGQYIALEFLGETNGTIYICTREIFRDYFYPRLNTSDGYELSLFFQKNKNLCAVSRSHSGKWQAHLKNIISKKQMGQMLQG
ncbi:MAG: hypothetical protein HUJ76_04070 [Parasporobacterium sp.]|nr:hypothetical protein [Parasporobacterium sp.]